MDEFENIEERSGNTEAMLTAFEDEPEYSNTEVNNLTSDETSEFATSNIVENGISSDENEYVQPSDEQALIDKYKSSVTESVMNLRTIYATAKLIWYVGFVKA